MTPLSLKWRLGLCTAGVVSMVIGLICVFAYREFRQGLRQGVDATLRSQAEAVAVSITADDSLTEARREVTAFFGQADRSGMPVYAIWFEGTDTYYLQSHNEENWPLDWRPTPEAMPLVGGHRFFDVQRKGDPYRLLWVRRPGRSMDEPLNILIATYDGLTLEQVQDFLGVLVLLGISTILLAVLAMVPILGWGLKPVAKMTAQMDELTDMNIHACETLQNQPPAELKPFVQAWNRMIQRLALAMRQQRRFTADASHEMRTPLAILKSTFQTIRSHRRDVESYESAIDRSLEDLERLEHLTNQLLALAHLDDISDQANWGLVPVEKLVADVCEQFISRVEFTGGMLEWHLCPAVVKGNPDQLRRLLGNLLDNAIKYGPHSGKMSVSMQCHDNGVDLVVHDDGGTIPPQEIGRIFDRFYRIRNSRTSLETGSGLGLAIAHAIVCNHYGHIKAKSDPEYGTDFIVTLPQFLE